VGGTGGLLAPRPPERADAQVKKDQQKRGRGQKRPVIGAVEVVRPGAPEGRAKDQHEEEEEDACNLKPQDAAYAAEGTQKTTYTTGDATAGLTGSSPGGAALNGRVGRLLDLRRAGGGLRSGRDALASDAPGDAEADAQGASDGVRFHSVYDGSSGRCRAAFLQIVGASLLPRNADGSKVEESHAATAFHTRCLPLWRYP
jgi:hypothetical protein